MRSRVPKSLPSYVGADRQRDAGVPSGGSIETRRVRPNKRLFGGAGAEPPRTARSAGHLGKNTDRVSPPKSGLAIARELRELLWTIASERASKCGRVRIAPDVDIAKRYGRAHFHGIMRCSLLWECPVCSRAIKAARADEVRKAVAWHGAEGVLLLTLTMRHGLGDDLKVVRKGLTCAWQKMQSGKQWGTIKAQMGFAGSIRALEVTHGPNGWHPHIHVLLFTREMTASDLEELRQTLSARWQRCVEKALGTEHRPNDRNGCDLKQCFDSNYLNKLGLELTAPIGKDAQNENRAPMQIAYDFVTNGSEADLILWRTYCKGMKGARMLTWSRGLRDRAGLNEEQTDEEIVNSEDAEEVFITRIFGKTWDKIRDIRGITHSLLSVAEKDGEIGVEMLIARLSALRVDKLP